MSKHDFYQVSLKLILKNRKGQVLILAGKMGGSFEGFFVLPGGRINNDEIQTDLMQVLRREVQEELGNIEFDIDPHPAAVGRHFVPASQRPNGQDAKYFYVFFEGRYHGGEIQLDTREHPSYQWLDCSQIDLAKYFKSGMLEGLRMYGNY